MQLIHTKKKHKNKENILNLTVQSLEKYSSALQQLASRGWHRVNRQEELLTGGGREVGDGRAEGPSAIADGGRPAVALTPDADGSHVRIFETSQLEGLYVGDLLYFFFLFFILGSFYCCNFRFTDSFFCHLESTVEPL